MESPKSSMISFAFAYDSPIGRRLSEHSLTMLRSSMYTMPLTMSYGRNTITARMCSSSPPHVATFHGHIRPTHFARSDLRRLPCLVFNGPIPPKMVRYAMTNKLAAHIPAPIKPEYAAQARDMPAPYQASTNIPSVRPSSSDAPSSDAQEARARRKFPKVRSPRLTPSGSRAQAGPSRDSQGRSRDTPIGSGETRGCDLLRDERFSNLGHHVAGNWILQPLREAQLDLVCATAPIWDMD